MLVAGLPPLPGFVAKFALLSTALGFAEGNGAIWGLAAGILVSGFAAVFATTRIGMRLFWTTVGRRTPRLRILEALPVASLVLLTLGISAASGSVMTYFEAAADSLHDPQAYIRAVLSPQEGVEPGGGSGENKSDKIVSACADHDAHGHVAGAEPVTRAGATGTRSCARRIACLRHFVPAAPAAEPAERPPGARPAAYGVLGH